jgi:hypothetical protein
MSSEAIAFIIFFGSFLGLMEIVIRKVPLLVSLPAAFPQQKEDYLGLKRRIKRTSFFENFSFDVILQNILTKIRVLSLKTDSKTFDWLQKIRQNSQKKKIREDKNYWEEIKKATKE